MKKYDGYIGVFDSGVGGVSVLRELTRLMPNEKYIYMGDSANAPYGTKTKEEIFNYATGCAHYLADNGVKALVVACNTATSVCIVDLRLTYSHMPIVGIEPAIKPALKEKANKKIGVMATPLTLKEDKFNRLLDSFNTSKTVVPLPCPGLMELVERGLSESEEAYKYLSELFEGLYDMDALVLGCTHYPFLKSTIRKILPAVRIYDGGEGTARQLKRLITESGIAAMPESGGKVEFINTLNDKNQNELAKLLWSKK